MKCLPLPPRSPNLNAHAERWIRSIKEECLSKLILFGENSLRRVVSEFLEHYHQERNHQGKDNLLLSPTLLGKSAIPHVRSAVESGSVAYRNTTVVPHEYFGLSASSEKLACSVGESPTGERVRTP